MSIDHTTRPRIGSVCTGYGGLDLAVELVLGGRATAGITGEHSSLWPRPHRRPSPRS